MLIDTHAHLYLEHFRDDIDEVIHRCELNGVEKVVLPNIDTESIPGLVELCTSYPERFYPLVGLHPCSVKANSFVPAFLTYSRSLTRSFIMFRYPVLSLRAYPLAAKS